MNKIKLNLASSPVNGQQISFIAPCSSADTECLVIKDIEYSVVDADGVSVAGVENVWNSGAVVSTILNVDSHSAFIQNANTNTYLEGTMVKKTDYATIGGDYGLIKLPKDNSRGLQLAGGELRVFGGGRSAVRSNNVNCPICTSQLDYAIKVGLLRCSGYNTTDLEETIGLTDVEKQAVLEFLGAMPSTGDITISGRITTGILSIAEGGYITYNGQYEYLHEGNIKDKCNIPTVMSHSGTSTHALSESEAVQIVGLPPNLHYGILYCWGVGNIEGSGIWHINFSYISGGYTKVGTFKDRASESEEYSEFEIMMNYTINSESNDYRLEWYANRTKGSYGTIAPQIMNSPGAKYYLIAI